MSATVRFEGGVLAERTADNGDGTGTRVTFDSQGVEIATEALTGLPIPEPDPVDPYAVYAAAVEQAQTMQEVRDAAAALAAALEDQ